MLTAASTTALLAKLSEVLGVPVGSPALRPVSGGDISTALTAATPAGQVFIKYQAGEAELRRALLEFN